jgi:broad specificity phosphatase PhoE
MNAAEEFNSALSPLGAQQASDLARAGAARGRPLPADVELVVASSLRRAIHTAALVFPAAEGYPRPILCLDETREFAGPPTSEKRHRRSEIHGLLGATVDALGGAGTAEGEVDLSLLTEEDELWAPTEEPGRSAYGRADKALAFLMEREETTIACVGHTSFMSACLLGGRNRSLVVHASEDETRRLQSGFRNAEVRCVEMWQEASGSDPAKFHIRPLYLEDDEDDEEKEGGQGASAKL